MLNVFSSVSFINVLPAELGLAISIDQVITPISTKVAIFASKFL